MFYRHLLAAVFLVHTSAAWAGAVFITGHDPDFHAQDNTGAQNLLRIGLNYARNGDGTTTTDANALPVLWIESDPAEDGGIPSGHRFGLNGLRNIGYRAVGESGTASEGRYVFANANALTDAFWNTVTTDNYSAIGVASTFGGLLRPAELANLNAHATQIAGFFNAGGGIFAGAEGTEGQLGFGVNDGFFNWIPIDVPSQSTPAPGYRVTPFGASLGLTNGDVSSPSHSYFTSGGGLDVVSLDAQNRIMTLAGIRNIDTGGGGFTPLPEPATMALLALGLLGAGFARKRRTH